MLPDPVRLSGADILRLMRPSDWLQAARDGLVAAAADPAGVEPRRLAPVTSSGGVLAAMLGSTAGSPWYGAKVVSVSDRPKALGEQPHQGAVLLFDGRTGGLRALADGAVVTQWRTAWASAAATDRLARPDARVLGVVGTGAQAVAHGRAAAHVRRFERISVWGRDAERAAAAAREIAQATGVTAEVRRDLPPLLAQSDVVCTTTAARQPLFEDGDLPAGVHVNAVGASTPGHCELPPALLLRSDVYVDHLASALAQADDLRAAWPEGPPVGRLRLIGDALAAEGRPPRDESRPSIFRSVGVITQDLAAVARCLERTQEVRPPQATESPSAPPTG